MGVSPDAARSAFSFRSCPWFWAARTPQTVRSPSASLFMCVSLSCLLTGLLARSAFFFASRILVQLVDEFRGFRGNAPPLGNDVTVRKPFSVDGGVIVGVLPQGGSCESDS